MPIVSPSLGSWPVPVASRRSSRRGSVGGGYGFPTSSGGGNSGCFGPDARVAFPSSGLCWLLRLASTRRQALVSPRVRREGFCLPASPGGGSGGGFGPDARAALHFSCRVPMVIVRPVQASSAAVGQPPSRAFRGALALLRGASVVSVTSPSGGIGRGLCWVVRVASRANPSLQATGRMKPRPSPELPR